MAALTMMCCLGPVTTFSFECSVTGVMVPGPDGVPQCDIMNPCTAEEGTYAASHPRSDPLKRFWRVVIPLPDESTMRVIVAVAR